jgi:hypothetical protein
MYENRKMRHVEIFQEWERKLKENDGEGEFNNDIL